MKDLATPPIRDLELDPEAETRAWAAVVSRRRRRRAGSQSLLVVVALLLAGSPLLLRQGLPEQGRVTASQEVERTPSVETSSDDTASQDLVTDSDNDRGRGSRSASTPTSVANKTSDSGSSRPGAGNQTSRSAVKEPVRRERQPDFVVGCLPEWCVRASAVNGPDAVSITVELCVAQGTRVRRFSFPSSQEVDFEIRPSPDGDVIWKWSVGQTFPRDDHNVDVGSGECVRWTTDWVGVTEDGQGAEPGTFELTGFVLAEQAGPRPMSATTSFQYEGSE